MIRKIRKCKNIKLIFAVIFVILIIGSGFYFLYSKRYKRPNILIITIDSLRADHLGCYGYKRNTTPNIDKLAAEGVRFSQVITQAPWTHPSNCSFFTSTYPYMHIIGFESYLNPAKISLARILKGMGYTTTFITDHKYWMNQIHGFKEQFDTYITLAENTPEEVTKVAREFLKKKHYKKFFLWIYYLGVHENFGTFSQYSQQFYNDGLVQTRNIPIQSSNSEEVSGVIPKHVVENNISDVAYYISKYDGQIRIIDDQITLVLEELRKLNLDENTLLILTADHGESLGEHGLYFQHRNLYDPSLKVPLILRYPKLVPKNKIITTQVRLIDVVPTILDIVKIKNRNYKHMEGKSLMNLLMAEEDGEFFCSYAFSELYNWLFSVRSEEWKLIYVDIELMMKDQPEWSKFYKNRFELYNLKNNPNEENNLVEIEKEKFLILKKKIDSYVKQARSYFPRALLEVLEVLKESSVLDEETKEKLKNLGYLQ